MVAITVLVVILSCLYIVASASTPSEHSVSRHPGKVAIWSIGNVLASTQSQYNTASTNFKSAVHIIKGALSTKSELNIVLRAKDHKSIELSNEAIFTFAQKVSASTVIPYIYRTETSKHDDLHHHLSASDFMKGSKKVSLEEIHSAVSESVSIGKGLMFDHHADVVEASLSGNASIDSQRLSDLASIAAKSGKTISIVACQEPGVEAYELNTDAKFSRVLGNSDITALAGSSSDKTDGIYYKPSGAEYSIYYANTYLYITPDILTGLLTGLFMAGVIYAGLSSMNKIQGGSNFPIRKIDNGKEM